LLYIDPGNSSFDIAPYINININYQTMFKQIRKTMQNTNKRCHFNMGEMLDSLALDHITNLSTMLIPFIADFKPAYLMLLTTRMEKRICRNY